MANIIENNLKNDIEHENPEWGMVYGSERFDSLVPARNHNKVFFAEGPRVSKLSFDGKGTVLLIPKDPIQLDIWTEYPSHSDSLLPIWYVILYHGQYKTNDERQYLEIVAAGITADDLELKDRALVYLAKNFWDKYKSDDDNGKSASGKKRKQLTRIVQDFLLYVNAPIFIFEQEQSDFLNNHKLSGLIKKANTARSGELTDIKDLENEIEETVNEFSSAYSQTELEEAYTLWKSKIHECGNGGITCHVEGVDFENALSYARLLDFDLLIGNNHHDQDVITIIPDSENASLLRFNSDINDGTEKRRKILDVITVDPSLNVWDGLGKLDEYQPLSMIIATHSKAYTPQGHKLQEELSGKLTPELTAAHYLGCANKFLYDENWSKSFAARRSRSDMSAFRKLVPLARVAVDLLPRAIYMKKTGKFPAGISNKELYEIGETGNTAYLIEEMLAKDHFDETSYDHLYQETVAVLDRWITEDDILTFEQNTRDMNASFSMNEVLPALNFP